MSKIAGKWVKDDGIGADQIRLANNTDLTARNQANSADLNLLKANATDRAEFGVEPVYAGGAPTLSTSLVTKGYVLDVIAGVRDPKDAARWATAAALPANTPSGSGVGKIITGDANGILTVDGHLMVLADVGSRILVKDEGSLSDGVYTLTDEGDAGTPFILTRATDCDEDAEVSQGLSIDIVEGTANGKSRWLLTTADPFTVDTTVPTFVEVPTAQTLVQFKDEEFVLDGTDISNGYVDLLNESQNGSIVCWPDGGPPQDQGTDFTLSVVSLVTRVTFAGDLASTLISGDKLVVNYAHF